MHASVACGVQSVTKLRLVWKYKTQVARSASLLPSSASAHWSLCTVHASALTATWSSFQSILVAKAAMNSAGTHTGQASSSVKQSSRPIIRGVVFDMDGTLTVPVIDFQEMRRRVGILEGDILAIIDSWPAEKKAEALHTLKEFELQALADMEIMPGVLELCRMLDQAGIPRGLITRNVKSSVDYFHANHFPLRPFSPALSRECHMYKPSPAPLLHCCSQWGIPASQVLIVGDSAKDDVVCGNRAGALTMLLDSSGLFAEGTLEGEQVPTVMVRTMEEATAVLQNDFELQGLHCPGGRTSPALHPRCKQSLFASTEGIRAIEAMFLPDSLTCSLSCC